MFTVFFCLFFFCSQGKNSIKLLVSKFVTNLSLINKGTLLGAFFTLKKVFFINQVLCEVEELSRYLNYSVD